jgi:hypothetical protein
VEAGDLLFQLDTRLFEAQAETARCQIRAALVTLENRQTQFSFYERLKDKSAVSELQYEQSYYALKEAEEQLKIAESDLLQVEANVEMSHIRAPIGGEILQVNVHVGEVAPNVVPFDPHEVIPYGSIQYPLILMGRVEPLIEPYIVPKASFTGQLIERIDTRVLQVLYRFENKQLPIYAGQILDVFIEAPALLKSSDQNL